MLDESVVAPLVRMVLENVAREYPNHVMHMYNSDADALSPRMMHPAFYGSYDWHSAVHSHWMLVRVLRLLPQANFSADIIATLDRHLTAANIGQECVYFEAPHRATFERPYGLAWVLQLAAELVEWNVSDAQRWRTVLKPMEQLAARRIAGWLPKLGHPIRGGEHANSAFSLALAYDWARTVHDDSMRECIAGHSRRFYAADRNAPLAYEPSGQDFLSPSLAEADLMRRVLSQREFSEWLSVFMPQLPTNDETAWLPIATPRDPADPKLSHLDGLNLSRAWMLEGIAGALPADDARRAALLNTARLHADAGIAAIRSELYEGSHWLPSFAVYLLSRRGIPAR